MVRLECPECSAALDVDESHEYAYCTHCGARFSLVERGVYVGAPIGPEAGDPEVLACRASELAGCGRHQQALEAYGQLARECPDDWRGWWGIIESMSLIDPAADCSDSYQRFLALAPADVAAQKAPQWAQISKRLELVQVDAQIARQEAIASLDTADLEPRIAKGSAWIVFAVMCGAVLMPAFFSTGHSFAAIVLGLVPAIACLTVFLATIPARSSAREEVARRKALAQKAAEVTLPDLRRKRAQLLAEGEGDTEDIGNDGRDGDGGRDGDA